MGRPGAEAIIFAPGPPKFTMLLLLPCLLDTKLLMPLKLLLALKPPPAPPKFPCSLLRPRLPPPLAVLLLLLLLPPIPLLDLRIARVWL